MEIENIEKILAAAKDKRICIIGDVMLDIYMLGDVNRISPEAPVQVFDIMKNEPKLGGAANVGLNVKTLGANPFLIGVIGNDSEAHTLKKVMENLGQDTSGLITEENRPTTCKTRVIADSHHLLRIDSESKSEISKETEDKILDLLKSHSSDFDIMILQDYNKGVLTKSIISRIINFAKESGIRILVDPKFENFFEYKNTYIFKPNRKELEDAFGKKAKIESELVSLCKELIKKVNCENLILTLGGEGIKIFQSSDGDIKIDSFGTRARKVADVSGAGDTVISTIAVCLAGGASLQDSVVISNFAAGLVCEEVGIVPIENEQLKKYIAEHSSESKFIN
ncbi:MAG: D-glycero-beta-D-manno-heptose-7-phosphate kinase [Ignavibacteria bacterium]|nr:D-glycero-beta-D-manno-heptose-7-phosphate kinase [Ignavibacteria bacterium]